MKSYVHFGAFQMKGGCGKMCVFAGKWYDSSEYSSHSEQTDEDVQNRCNFFPLSMQIEFIFIAAACQVFEYCVT